MGDVFLLRTIIPNFEVEFKESDKIMMQNTEKPLLRKQEALSEKKDKKGQELLDRMNRINRIKKCKESRQSLINPIDPVNLVNLVNPVQKKLKRSTNNEKTDL